MLLQGERVVGTEVEHVAVGETESVKLRVLGALAEELLTALPSALQEHLDRE